ncbi:hypothetical protein ACHHYP_05998, partial [Achlya hypogyna]
APLKAWFLSRYGFVPTTTTQIVNLNWDTVLNGRFLTQLYTNAGIRLDAPLAAMRFINVFADFKVLPRSHAAWAGSFYGTERVYQMDLDGRPLRRALDGAAEWKRFANDVAQYAVSGFNLWGTERIFDYVPPATTDCGVGDVAEAVLCLKGLTLDAFVNVQFQSSLHPLTNADDKAAVAAWRSSLFTNLDSCLARRAALLQTASTPQAALVQLATELATQYNLSLVNIAGTKLLFATTTFLEGYLDISGQRAGAATYEISGRDLTGVILGGSGFLDSIFAPRETAWWCSIQYVDPATGHPNAAQCFERVGATLPAFFVGKYLTVYSGSRYNDNADFEAGISTGNLTAYHYKRHTVGALADVRLAALGNRTTWADWIKVAIAAVAQQPVDKSDAIEELCLVGDGCFSACMNETASGGTTYTYMRGGTCVTMIDTVMIPLTELYADLACLGFGSGTSAVQVTYISADSQRHTKVRYGAASPMAIIMCFVGGRIPNGDYYPSFLIDMLAQGTEASIVVTTSNGSEAIMLNFIALVSLVGYIFFLFWVVLSAVRSELWLRRQSSAIENVVQMRNSLHKCNLSTRVWMLQRTAMRITGFLGLVAWHIGASRARCQWVPASISSVSETPVYACDVDPFGHVTSANECVRLFAYAWVFFALTFMDRMPGITVHTTGYGVAVLLLCLLPLSLWAVVLAEAWRWRAGVPAVAWIHSQLFLALLWLAVIALMRSRLAHPYITLVDHCLYKIGMRKQVIDSNSPFRALVGEYFWTHATLHREGPTAYLPLNLLLQTPNIDLSCIRQHEYWVSESRQPPTETTQHPSWVHTHVCYYVRIRK